MGKTFDAVEKRIQEALKAGNVWVKISPVELAEMEEERKAEEKKPAKKSGKKANNG